MDKGEYLSRVHESNRISTSEYLSANAWEIDSYCVRNACSSRSELTQARRRRHAGSSKGCNGCRRYQCQVELRLCCNAFLRPCALAAFVSQTLVDHPPCLQGMTGAVRLPTGPNFMKFMPLGPSLSNLVHAQEHHLANGSIFKRRCLRRSCAQQEACGPLSPELCIRQVLMLLRNTG